LAFAVYAEFVEYRFDMVSDGVGRDVRPLGNFGWACCRGGVGRAPLRWRKDAGCLGPDSHLFPEHVSDYGERVRIYRVMLAVIFGVLLGGQRLLIDAMRAAARIFSGQ
jgi:hypothetical protein